LATDTGKQFNPAIGYITMMQYYLGNMIGLTQDEVISRYKFAVEDQMNVTQSCENISSLYDRHTTSCQQLVGPGGFDSVKEYLKK
jgi:hypothetical protein